MRQLERLFVTLFALVALGPAWPAFGQTQSITNAAATAAIGQPPANVRRLSIDEAVKLGLEQNLGIQVERVNPRIQDLVVAQAQNLWTPVGFTTINNNSRSLQPDNAFAGGLTSVNDQQFSTQFGVNQTLKTGGSYSAGWLSYRATSTNLFNNYDPRLSSTLQLNVTQPLLRNFKTDTTRQQLAVSHKDRDVRLAAARAIARRRGREERVLGACVSDGQPRSGAGLDLAKRVLSDNENACEIGTMAPIDIVEAQAEVAERGVIISQAAIERAGDYFAR